LGQSQVEQAVQVELLVQVAELGQELVEPQE
jgi:hypothetical protein